jgi:hypothetical protein
MPALYGTVYLALAGSGRNHLMIRYHHRQLGTLILVVGGLSILLLALLLYFVEAHPVGIAVLCLLVVSFALFSTLTVEVTETYILLKFGPGLIRKRFSLGSITSARAVRNPWYAGCGIHMLPRGWLYNVSGSDAVELEMTDGSVHRIGTDQPAELLGAIRNAGGITG